jgi:hypothetical protein
MDKLVYEEEELRATRERLHVKDEEDARLMMKILGGEVGDVRYDKEDAPKGRSGWNRPYTKSSPQRRIETVGISEESLYSSSQTRRSSPENLDYRERIKMDSQEARTEFKIKTWFQSFRSKLAFFYKPPDVVSKVFVITKMEDYILPLNKLVNKVRLIFPRNNTARSKKFKQNNPFAFSILDTIRYWNIEKISASLARLQAHPRAVVISDFQEIIKEFYRPLILLEMLDSEEDVSKAVVSLDYMLENDPDNQITNSTQDEIAILFDKVTEDTRWRLYPFLLKFISDSFIPCESFFNEYESKIRAFLGISPQDIIRPSRGEEHQDANAAKDTTQTTEEADTDEGLMLGMPTPGMEENPAHPVSPNSKPKAVQRGLNVLEQLFPEAGWETLDAFPDIYHYFVKSLSLKKNADVIDPVNPMLQALVLMQILEELFYGFRSITFNEVGFDLPEFLEIIDEWHKLIENCFERAYLPRLAEFVKLFYNPLEPKQKIYTMKLREELNWLARLFLFPSLKIDSFSQMPVHKNDVTPIFPKIRILRQDFVVIAEEIEKALQEGGASVRAHCAAVKNPWDPYVFQVANPLSKRLDMLLGKENRTNISLIYYTLSVLTVLDYFINNPNSWAYQTNTAKLFRSSDAEGLLPESLPEAFIDADAVFMRSIEKLKAQSAQNATS